MAPRITTMEELKHVLDVAELESLQALRHCKWVVWQTWGSNMPPPGMEPELHGPYDSGEEALGAMERAHAAGLAAKGWIDIYGEPHTFVVPVFPDSDI